MSNPILRNACKLAGVTPLLLSSLIAFSSYAYVIDSEQIARNAIFHSTMTANIENSGNTLARREREKAENIFHHAQKMTAPEQEEQRQALFQKAIATMISANSIVTHSAYEPSEETKNSKGYQAIQFRQKQKAISSLINAHESILKEKHIVDSNIVPQVDKLVAYAHDYLDNQQFTEANVVLEQAYRLVKTSVSRLRSGETLVFELNLTTPQDEYQYYLAKVTDSLNSFNVFTQHMTDLGKKVRLQKVQHKISELLGNAEPLANNGDYFAAAKVMESAFKEVQSGLYLILN